MLCLSALLALSSANVAITLTSKGNASQVQHLGPPHPCNILSLKQETKTLKSVCPAQVKKAVGHCERLVLRATVYISTSTFGTLNQALIIFHGVILTSGL